MPIQHPDELRDQIATLQRTVDGLTAALDDALAAPPRRDWVPMREAAHRFGYSSTDSLRSFIGRHNANPENEPIPRNGHRVHLPTLERAMRAGTRRPALRPPADAPLRRRTTRTGNRPRRRSIYDLI